MTRESARAAMTNAVTVPTSFQESTVRDRVRSATLKTLARLVRARNRLFGAVKIHG